MRPQRKTQLMISYSLCFTSLLHTINVFNRSELQLFFIFKEFQTNLWNDLPPLEGLLYSHWSDSSKIYNIELQSYFENNITTEMKCATRVSCIVIFFSDRERWRSTGRRLVLALFLILSVGSSICQDTM